MAWIGIVAESVPGETRVSATPETVGKLIGLGYAVRVESGAGLGSSFTDAAYEGAGASIGTRAEAWDSEIVLKVNAPSSDEIALLAQGATLVGLISPSLSPELLELLAVRPITVLAMDAVPRISRAQSLDVLSSMANIAGYRAVVEAAHAVRALLHRPGDRSGKGPSCEGAGCGGRGCRACGDRGGGESGCDRPGHGPSARGSRSGAVTWR